MKEQEREVMITEKRKNSLIAVMVFNREIEQSITLNLSVMSLCFDLLLVLTICQIQLEVRKHEIMDAICTFEMYKAG